jgi:hypothetical protein
MLSIHEKQSRSGIFTSVVALFYGDCMGKKHGSFHHARKSKRKKIKNKNPMMSTKERMINIQIN